MYRNSILIVEEVVENVFQLSWVNPTSREKSVLVVGELPQL
jgi:hypothetical protein